MEQLEEMANAAEFYKMQASVYENESQMLLNLNQYERVKTQLLQDELAKENE